MKIRSAIALLGLAISSAVPSFCQQTNKPDPKLREVLINRIKAHTDALDKNDAAAVAANFTEDAVNVEQEGPTFGRHAIEKLWADRFQKVHFSSNLVTVDEDSPHITMDGKLMWATGAWSATIKGEKFGPTQIKGYWSVIREGDDWKIRMLTSNVTPAPAAASPVVAQEGMKSITPDELVWKEHPVLKGAQIAILAGDPAKAETIVQRIKFPPNFKVPPHTHPYSEVVTVLSGTYWNAMGDDMEKGGMLKPGSVFVLPANHTHRVWTTDEEVIIQVNFTGPGGITFINPADDPRTAETK
jgi:ketosteroid isomerase-like protein/quercetin dioxygenase-like cupin family protein